MEQKSHWVFDYIRYSDKKNQKEILEKSILEENENSSATSSETKITQLRKYFVSKSIQQVDSHSPIYLIYSANGRLYRLALMAPLDQYSYQLSHWSKRWQWDLSITQINPKSWRPLDQWSTLKVTKAYVIDVRESSSPRVGEVFIPGRPFVAPRIEPILFAGPKKWKWRNEQLVFFYKRGFGSWVTNLHPRFKH